MKHSEELMLQIPRVEGHIERVLYPAGTTAKSREREAGQEDTVQAAVSLEVYFFGKCECHHVTSTVLVGGAANKSKWDRMPALKELAVWQERISCQKSLNSQFRPYQLH